MWNTYFSDHDINKLKEMNRVTVQERPINDSRNNELDGIF
jgi:hypothetical protein